MDDCSWIFQYSKEGLYIQDYLKIFRGFIIFILYNSKNISGVEIRYLCAKWKNKNIHNKYVVTMHIFKK